MNNPIEDFLPPPYSKVDQLTQDLGRILLSKAYAEKEISSAKRQLASREAMLFLAGDIDGRTEKHRQAQLVIAMTNDVEASALVTKMEKAESEVAMAKAQEARLSHSLGASSAYARLAASMITAHWKEQ